jgi:arsenate reductase (glutaredoxin)
MSAMAEVTVWHNPRCSKSRGACALLAEHDLEPRVRRYLDDPPSREELEQVLRLLGADDPRAIMRTGDRRYRELELDTADREQLLEALVAEPALLERPIVIRDGAAVVARPPERLLALLDE